MSELQDAYADNSLFDAMSDMNEYILSTWSLSHTRDFFAPPLPQQELYRCDDPWLIFALFSLAKTTSNVQMARKALRVVLTRDEHEGEVTARDVQEARDYVVKNMEPEALQRYNNILPGLRRDEVRWNRYKHEYEKIYHDLLRRCGRQGNEWGTRSISRRGSRDDRRRSRPRSPAARSPSRYRPRSRSPPRPRGRERSASIIDERPIPPPQPSFQRSRPAEPPANRGAKIDHFNEYAIETPDLVADPPGATFDEQLVLRDEAVQLLGAQEEYYEAVRRKMLSRYMERVQKYEREVIQIRKRVAGGEGTRYERDDGRRGRGDRGHERENRDGRRR